MQGVDGTDERDEMSSRLAVGSLAHSSTLSIYLEQSYTSHRSKRSTVHFSLPLMLPLAGMEETGGIYYPARHGEQFSSQDPVVGTSITELTREKVQSTDRPLPLPL